ncbi:MAG: transposase [Paludibacter sp.]|nr:transposase [Paludibacter sp.]
MFFKEDCTYHIFNRSNEIVFYNRENYLFFLRKIREYVLPYANILSYCLMPNHFHIILIVKPEGITFFENKKIEDLQVLARAIGTVLSSYTQALNKQLGRRGSLFAHKTKAKILNDAKDEYALNCFMYVHQNPIFAKLVDKVEDWEFSSFHDYIGTRKGTLVNIQLGFDIFQIEKSELYKLTYIMMQDKFDEDFI